MTSARPVVRELRPEDDLEVVAVIRAVMAELGADGPGTSAGDLELDAPSAAYGGERAAFFVVADAATGRILGGGGVGPLAGGDDDVCELRKMYLLPEARGRGAGRALLHRCLEAARALGYRRVYLETMTSMVAAQRLYERAGFRRLPRPQGATGHFGCDRWYAREP